MLNIELRKPSVLVIALISPALMLCGLFKSKILSTPEKPGIMLWAWETPSDLRWLNPQRIGVAYLSETVTLYGDRIWIKPRMQPLKVPDNTYLVQVVRIERSLRNQPTLSENQLDRLVSHLQLRAKQSDCKGLQIDYDARYSERTFYRALLHRLSQQLPTRVELSMTALASWCIGDRWLKNIEVDEVVPMLFSMGKDNQTVVRHIRAGKKLDSRAGQIAIGLAESAPEVGHALKEDKGKALLKGKRVYLFSCTGWTEGRVDQILRRMAI
ncbi:MAG: DUF3142 domain-containing protein [Candidatus Obscuribacterales bacterium]|nr:DUF3142 domain-containing protein [Candidatus Obscuribacterales bacterium]